MGKPPSAPNPVATANAQTASNRETAITQAGLNAVNQVTPYGNLTYTQGGKWADGTPQYTATQTLSGAGQQLFDTGMQTQQNLASLAQEQSGRLSGLLNAPLDWSQQQGYLNDLTAQNLDPQWDRLSQQNEQSLINRGLRPGTTAYQQASDDFLQSRSSAYNNANLNNFNSAFQSQLAMRNQPLNEILALAGQGQVQQPNFVGTPQTGVAGTDVAGIQNAAFGQQMAGYNANQSALGGLFSAGASLIPLLSDRRAKTDIKRIGTAFNGLPIYVYRYEDGGQFHIGFMADEVEQMHPDAVIEGGDGFKRVFYDKAVA
jgi:hypothetical protein